MVQCHQIGPYNRIVEVCDPNADDINVGQSMPGLQDETWSHRVCVLQKINKCINILSLEVLERNIPDDSFIIAW